MAFNKIHVIRILILNIIFLALIANANARVEISDFFSDFTSADVTLNSSQDLNGDAVFELFYAGDLVESHKVPFNMMANTVLSRVIIWEKKPTHDYYTAKISIFDDGKLLTNKSYQISYGTVSLPGFHVVDFTPSNKGIQMLLNPFNPSVADIRFELIEDNDIIYTETQDAVSLSTVTDIQTTWPFILSNNRKYYVRAKIFTHRLNSPPFINTYIADFIAKEEVEILRDDVQVDEYGASVTMRGKSQVPFDGFLVVNARNQATNETLVFRTRMEEILVTGKEDTSGIVWKGMAPGTYDIEILAEDKENVAIDRYETVLRIPEASAAATATPSKAAPGFEAFLLVIILASAWRFKGGS
jgi:hypothetical protein